METFANHKFRIVKNQAQKWMYQIIEGNQIIVESKENFEYEGIARFAAIGHISLLEQGKS